MTGITERASSLRDSANRHLWMGGRDWQSMEAGGDPLVVVSGKGIRVSDSEGNSYIDVNAGHSFVNVGYGRDEIAEAVHTQAAGLNYFPQMTTVASTVELCRRVAELAPGNLNRMFPVSGGSEAVETALKVARAYYRRRSESGRYKIISRIGSNHGELGLSQWLGSEVKSRSDYEPSAAGMIYAPQPDSYVYGSGDMTSSQCAVRCAKAIEELIEFHQPSTVAAVIAEPITRNGVVPGDEYWPMLREICNEYGILLIADEATTGFGRTGKMFAIEYWGVEPDIMVVGGSMSSGYAPVGGMIATEHVAGYFASDKDALKHVFTFAGHPVAATAAVSSIDIICREKLVDNAAQVGAYLLESLSTLIADHPIVGDVRGRGLLIGMELVSDRKTKARFDPAISIPKRLTLAFRKQGLILDVSGDTVQVAPPLTTTKDDADEIVHAIDLALWEIEGELGVATLA